MMARTTGLPRVCDPVSETHQVEAHARAVAAVGRLEPAGEALVCTDSDEQYVEACSL